MCVYSMVFDHYRPWFERWPQPPDYLPNPPIDWAEMAKKLAEFREAEQAAKTVDRLTGQPDCEDPEKAKLLKRIEALEKALAKRARKKPRKRSDGRKPAKKKRHKASCVLNDPETHMHPATRGLPCSCGADEENAKATKKKRTPRAKA